MGGLKGAQRGDYGGVRVVEWGGVGIWGRLGGGIHVTSWGRRGGARELRERMAAIVMKGGGGAQNGRHCLEGRDFRP